MAIALEENSTTVCPEDCVLWHLKLRFTFWSVVNMVFVISDVIAKAFL